MNKDHESPEERRERLRQEELKNPSSSVHGSNLADLVGGLNWKVTGSIIIVGLLIYFIYGIFLDKTKTPRFYSERLTVKLIRDQILRKT